MRVAAAGEGRRAYPPDGRGVSRNLRSSAAQILRTQTSRTIPTTGSIFLGSVFVVKRDGWGFGKIVPSPWEVGDIPQPAGEYALRPSPTGRHKWRPMSSPSVRRTASPSTRERGRRQVSRRVVCGCFRGRGASRPARAASRYSMTQAPSPEPPQLFPLRYRCSRGRCRFRGCTCSPPRW
jgi:hypothetical protein